VTNPPELSSAIHLDAKSIDSTVEAGAQFQQMLNVECITDFSIQPDLVSNFILREEIDRNEKVSN